MLDKLEGWIDNLKESNFDIRFFGWKVTVGKVHGQEGGKSYWGIKLKKEF